MELVFDHLVIWLAPVLCFTAEEAWLSRFGQNAESVHLKTFPVVPKEWKDEALAKKWAEIRTIRRVVTGALELARNEKKIGSSLQASIHVYLTGRQWDVLAGQSLATIGICSEAIFTHSESTLPSEAFTLPDVPGLGVIVGLAPGKKCERCWQVLLEVGSHDDHPDLCNRCHDAVTHGRK
jgi:isoleucyl-tRNA synthetase